MPTPRKAGRFGGSAAHHKHIVANLATELIRHGRIRTTHAKAKTVQPTADRLITFAKRGDIHSRRQAGKIVRDNDVLHHLFAEVGPANAERDGGYTRVLKLGPRKGDAAPMALIELVEQVGVPAGEGEADEPKRRWNLRRQRAQAGETEGAAATATAEAPPVEPEVADEDDTERPEADPAEVEARLAAEEGDTEADEAGDDDAAEGEDQDRA
jgi:large subunit ribosomal protein L17